MHKYTATHSVHAVRPVRPVRADGHWTPDYRYPSGRCIPVRREVRFNPRGR